MNVTMGSASSDTVVPIRPGPANSGVVAFQLLLSMSGQHPLVTPSA